MLLKLHGSPGKSSLSSGRMLNQPSAATPAVRAIWLPKFWNPASRAYTVDSTLLCNNTAKPSVCKRSPPRAVVLQAVGAHRAELGGEDYRGHEVQRRAELEDDGVAEHVGHLVRDTDGLYSTGSR